MKLIAEWGVHSPRLDWLLACGCPHCGGLVGRLTHRTRERRAVSPNAPRKSVECLGYPDIAGKPSAGFIEALAAQRESEPA
jgi:hypothetical protein